MENKEQKIPKVKKQKGVRKKISKLFLGVVIGGAVGSVVGMAVAPKSGKETRKIIREKGEEAWVKVSEHIEEKQKKEKKRGFWHFLNRLFMRKNK